MHTLLNNEIYYYFVRLRVTGWGLDNYDVLVYHKRRPLDWLKLLMKNYSQVVNNHFSLGNAFYDIAKPAQFPNHILSVYDFHRQKIYPVKC